MMGTATSEVSFKFREASGIKAIKTSRKPTRQCELLG